MTYRACRNYIIQNQKIVKILAAAFVLALVASVIGLVSADYNLGPDVSFAITEKEGRMGNLSVPVSGSPIIEYTVDITNHGPGSVNVEKAAFHNTIASWQATSDNLDQSLFTMTGKTHYEAGESGQTFFAYDTRRKNCGRVQIDAGFRDANNGNLVFIGTVINYGVDCSTAPPLANQQPIGALDVVNCTHIAGWAKDPDSPATPINVQIWDGVPNLGRLITTVLANQSRSDVGIHAFDVPTDPSLISDHTTHQIWVLAQDTTSGQYMLFANYKSFDFSTCTSSTPPPPPPGNPTLTIAKTALSYSSNLNSRPGYAETVIARPGSQVDFKMVVTNTGSATANNVVVSDTLPAHFTGTPTNFSLGNMAAGSTQTVILTATVGAASEFPVGDSTWTNTATASGSNVSSVSDTAQVIVRKDAVCTTGTIQVNSNLNSAQYTVSGASTFNGTGTQTFSNAQIGNYIINVPDISGYTKTVNPASGTLVCNGTLIFNITFTAVSSQTGTITVVKEVVNDNGGTAQPTDFALFIDNQPITHNQPKTLAPGNYRISEAQKSGYTLVGIRGACDGDGTVTLQAGQNLTCVVKNDDVPPGSFTATATATATASATASATCPNGQGSATATASATASATATATAATSQLAQTQAQTQAQQLAQQQATASASANAQAQANAQVSCGPSGTQLSIQKTVRNVTAGQTAFVESTNANPGDSAQFQMIVTNTGTATANNVAVSDVLPNHFTGSPTSFTLGNMTAGQSQTVTLTATAGSASEFPVGDSTWTNTATVSASNAASVSDGAQVVVRKGVVCTTGTVQISSNLQSASYTVSGTSTITGSGTQAFFNIPVGNYSIVTQDVSGYTKSVNPTNGILVCTGTLSFSIIYQQINSSVSIAINKSVRNITAGQSVFSKSISANPGDSIQFQMQVSASGNTSAQNVTVTDTLPNNFNLTSGSTVFNLGTMNPGSVQTVTLNGIVNQNNFCGTNTLINNAQATASNASAVSDTAIVSVSGSFNCGGSNEANLSLVKEVRNLTTGNSFSSLTSASSSNSVQFRLTVRNNNSSATANNVRLTDYLPAGLTYVPGTFQVDNSGSSGNLFSGSQYLGSLSPNQSRVITFQAQINSAGSQTLVNTGNVVADNANSTQASATVLVSGSIAGSNVNLILSKKAFNQTQNIDATVTTANSGDVILYTLTVQNTGNATASNFIFQDSLSDVLQLSQLQDFGSASFNMGNLSLSWPAQSIPAGGSIQQTFTVKVNASFPAGSDNLMTNTFGNTINVRVNKPAVLGVFVAPKTGSTSTLAFGLSLAVMLGFAAFKKRAAILTFSRNLVRHDYV